MDMIPELTLTSKESVKKEALILAKGDLKTAQEIYDFLVADMKELPDHDPVAPSWADKAKGTLNGTLGWINENKDTIEKVYSFITGFLGKSPTEPPAPIPPIN